MHFMVVYDKTHMQTVAVWRVEGLRLCVWLSEQVHEGSNIMLQCIVYCCRRQSETTRLLSVNSDLQDKLGSMHQKYSSQLQEGESVGAKVGQRLLYSASFGHVH